MHNFKTVFSKLQPLVSQQQTIQAVAGKHLETSQLTEHIGTFLRLSTQLVFHSLAARRVSPPVSFLFLPAFWLCETVSALLANR